MMKSKRLLKGRASARHGIRVAITQPLSLRYASPRSAATEAPERAGFMTSMRRQGWLLYYLLRDVSRP